MRRRIVAAVAAAMLAAATGCGGGDDGGSEGGERERLVVSAATSLTTAFTAYAAQLPGADVRLSFAGSDELAAQIEQGVRPDVFASANTTLPERLFEAGLVERPTVFARNRLVLAVPADGDDAPTTLDDLARPGTTIAVGAASVPVGAYTRTVLDRLPAARRRAILANVRSEEPDVGGIVGKLVQGAVDAGFVYATDVRAADGALRAIELPADLRPAVAYGVAIVRGAPNRAGARAFVDGLRTGAGRRALLDAGFRPASGA